MNRRFCLLILALAGLLALAACGGAPPAADVSSPPATERGSSDSAQPAQEDPTPPANADRAAERVAQMTLEEKVGQLFFARVPETGAAADVQTYHLGGYILFGRDTKGKTANELIQAINSYQAAADIPLLIGVDEEGGSVVRVSSNPHIRSEKFRSPQALYAAGGLDAVARDAHEKDVLLQALGFNVNLAPVADVSANSNDFINDRAFGQDAAQTRDYVSTVTEIMDGDGIGCVLKHFPGYGDNADTHTGIAVDNRPMETFTSSDFLPFTGGLMGADGRCAVLVSHNIVTCMDPDLPASLSPAVHQILRDLGFENNVVMTDDLVMDAVKAYAEGGKAAVLAVQAGNDLLIASDYRVQIPEVIAAVKDGSLDEALVDAACGRVLLWKMELGLL